MACGDQRRLTGSGSALEVVLHDDALYKSTFTLLYFTIGKCFGTFAGDVSTLRESRDVIHVLSSTVNILPRYVIFSDDDDVHGSFDSVDAQMFVRH